MKSVVSKIKPQSGFSHIFHIFLVTLLPAIIFVLVRIKLAPLAAIVILISKWRMFAVRPRYWLANIRANAVDLTIALSILVFMTNTGSSAWQLVWAVAYGIWLTLIKPGSSVWMVSLQAALGQLFGLTALFMGLGGSSALVLVVGAWAVAYLSARHFFSAYDEPHSSLLAHLWGYFAAALTWVLSHWLLFYGVIAQPTLLLTVLGFSLATLYYLDQTDRLSVFLRRQFILIMVMVVIVVIAFSSWSDKTI